MKESFQKVSPINKAQIFGRLSKVGSGAHLIYKVFFQNENDANKLYLAILPSLKRTIIAQGYESDESQALIELLVKAAPYGAKRRNFENLFSVHQLIGRNYRAILVISPMAIGIRP